MGMAWTVMTAKEKAARYSGIAGFGAVSYLLKVAGVGVPFRRFAGGIDANVLVFAGSVVSGLHAPSTVSATWPAAKATGAASGAAERATGAASEATGRASEAADEATDAAAGTRSWLARGTGSRATPHGSEPRFFCDSEPYGG